MRRALPMVVLAGLAACRGFDLPAEPAPPDLRRTVGVACEGADACLSGLCADGVCCQAQCATWEFCNDPSRPGACTARQRGAACADDADCPPGDAGGGHCRDGVCCDAPCDAPCSSCAVPGRVGECVLAPDDTDARHDCAGDCQMCYLGRCAPARVGNAAKCPLGTACSASGTCLVKAGGTCAADADCAAGHCLDAVCILDEVQWVMVPPMSSLVDRRNVVDLAIDDEGDLAVLFTESVSNDPYYANDLVLALSIGGTWTARRVLSDSVGTLGWCPGSVVYLGRSVYSAAYHERATGACGGAAQPPCGLAGQLWSPDGRATGFEPIDPGSYADWVDLVVDGEGTLFAVSMGAIQDGPGGLFANRRPANASGWDPGRVRLMDQVPAMGNWSELKRFYTAAVALDRGVVAVSRWSGEDAHDTTLVAQTWDGVAAPVESRATMPILAGDSQRCYPETYVRATAVGDGTVLVAVECQGWDTWGTRVLTAVFDPRNGSWKWVLTPDEGVWGIYAAQPLLPVAGHTPLFGLQLWDEEGNPSGVSLGWYGATAWTIAAGYQSQAPAHLAQPFAAASSTARRGALAFTLAYNDLVGEVPFGFSPDLRVLRFSDLP